MQTRHQRTTRRGFLKTGALAVGAPWVLPPSSMGLEAKQAPSNRIGLGFIGLGAMNSGHIGRYLGHPDVQIVAGCDPWAHKREAAQQRIHSRYADQFGVGSYRGCTVYNDFRDLIHDRNVDAVVIATPDHWHTIPALAAVRAGKDVYLEKPMTLTIEEGRVLADAVEQTGQIFQHGAQQRSHWDFGRAVELVRNGRIGRLRTIEVGIHAGAATEDHPEEPVPEGFDYSLWLGQAPLAPYCPARCVGVRPWILIRDYSGGRITSWGSHHLDIAHWAMDADFTGPIEIEGTGAFPEGGLYNTALTWRIVLRYANGVTVVFTDNIQQPQGIKFIGDKGWIFVSRTEIKAEPSGILRSTIGADELHLQTSRDHQQNFIDCIKSRAKTVSPAEIAHRSVTACHLTNICLQLGRKVSWDPQNERFVNDPEADKFISREMRKPWRL